MEQIPFYKSATKMTLILMVLTLVLTTGYSIYTLADNAVWQTFENSVIMVLSFYFGQKSVN